MVFYMDTGNDGADAINIEPEKPAVDEAMLLVSEFKYLQNYDFKEFNYYDFEQDISDMSAASFEWWYKSVFEKWLWDLDDRYLDINFESVFHKFDTQAEKRIFLLKIVNFVMLLLPYQLLKNIIEFYEIESSQELQEFLSEDINLINLRTKIIEEIDHNTTQFDSFVKTLLHFEKVAKKNLVEENIELLDEHIKKQNFFFEIFKSLINETDMEKIRDLIFVMLENDAKNIV